MLVLLSVIMELWLCKKMSIFRRFMPKYLGVMYHNVKTQIIQLKKCVCGERQTDRKEKAKEAKC